MSNQVRAGASSSEDVRLFLASARNFSGRYVAVTFTALAALPVLPLWAVIAWCVWVTGAVGLDWLMAPIVKRRDDEGLPTYALVPSLFASARAPYSLIGVLLWNTGAATAQLYAIVILCISTMYSLMQLYPRPRLLLAAISPHIAAVVFILGSVCLREIRIGQPWMVVTAVMAAITFGHFFVNTQRLLAASRAQLRKARARAEEQGLASEAATRAKSTFLAVMSHEIRTPLNGIMGMAQALATGELSETQRHRVEIIRESGESLLAILNDVLDLSKIEAGKLVLEDVQFEIDELMRGAHAAFTALANKKGLSFDLSIAPEARGVYMGDPTRLRQVVYNLISNALKFTERGAVRVTVTRSAGELEISVTDSGVGIAPEHMTLLFERFVQADASTTRQFGGTGLGLAICWELVTRMGGTITPQSVLGEGSTFTVTAPLPRVGDSAAAPSAKAAAATDAVEIAPVPARILAAEDNTMNQLVLKTLLAQIGILPTIVGNGAEAVEAWEGGAWDAILMDVQMPVMDGPTACRAIREREAASGRPRTPIIALTANVMAHQLAEYIASGMDAHVAKPIEVGKLFGVLSRAIDDGEPQAAVA